MNWIAGLQVKSRPLALGGRRLLPLCGALIGFAACGVETSESADTPASRDYEVHFSVQPDPSTTSVEVTMQLRQPRQLVRELTFPSVPDSMGDFRAEGELRQQGASLHWIPPAGGGTLKWHVLVEHQRQQNGLDAWVGPDWGIFRAEDIMPRARTRSIKGATSNTTLTFDLPNGWSVLTEYSGAKDPIAIIRPDRRFDQPTGWIVMGNLGVRREKISGIRVAVAAPQGESVRRMDMLAMLNWTLPELVSLLPNPPSRLTIISAGDPMWRGGLSAPASFFIHADRPLISENGTSALLHEVMHTTLSVRSADGMDWIIEGLAEYYGLELLRRGGAITSRRHAAAMAEQARWANDAQSLCGAVSTGATTARAVTLFESLDTELRDKSAGKASLDVLLRELLSIDAPVDVSMLKEIAANLAGEPSDALHIDNLPGCHRMAAGKQGS